MKSSSWIATFIFLCAKIQYFSSKVIVIAWLSPQRSNSFYFVRKS